MTCTECGTEFEARRPHQRFCARPCRNAYWNARYADAPRAPRPDRQPSRRPRNASASSRRPHIGTQAWITDPTVRVCKVEGCYFDAGTCQHGARKNRQTGGRVLLPP